MNSNLFEFKNSVYLISIVLAIWLFFYSLNTKNINNWYIANFIISGIINCYVVFLIENRSSVFLSLIFSIYFWALFSSIVHCFYANKKFVLEVIMVDAFYLGIICLIGLPALIILYFFLIFFCWDIGHCASMWYF